jgi:uncharacterized alpha-E superfamily protein
VHRLEEVFPKTETLLEEYFWNSNQTSSLQSTIRAMINNAYAVKERMSLDTWFIISRIQKIIKVIYPLKKPLSLDNRLLPN